jgi:DNA-directed RNA polymerase specialized sigma24 family protein
VAEKPSHHGIPNDPLSLLAALVFGLPETGDANSVEADARQSLAWTRATMSAEERGEIIAKFMRPLWGIAWKLAKPNHDLAEELRQFVLFKCESGCYNPLKGHFAAWARTVMSRRYITLKRSRDQGVGGDNPHPEHAVIHVIEIVEDDPRTTPFPDADLKRIRKWSAKKRAFLLTRSLLWGKLPDELRTKWMKAGGVPDSFPFAEFEDMSLAERNAFLARTFRIRLNSVHVRVRRWQKHLDELEFVRQLRSRM